MAKEYTQLTLRERYTIELLIQGGFSNKNIVLKLHRDKSTIGCEIRRNTAVRKNYLADMATEFFKNRIKRETASKFTPLLKDIIKEKLGIKWTLEQISAYLKSEHKIFVSHELIYQYINSDRKSGGCLYVLLPHRGKKYKKRNIKTRKKI